MTQPLALPLKVAWSYPQVIGFVLAPSFNRIIASLLNDGIAVLDFNGATQWHLKDDLPTRAIVRDTVAYVAWNGQLHRIDILSGQTRAQELEGSLIYVSQDGTGLMCRQYENVWETERYRSRIEFRSLLENSTALVWEHVDEGSLRDCTAFGTEYAIVANRLLIARKPARLLSIDLESGDVLWNANLNDMKPEPGVGVPADLRISPLVRENTVLAPTPFGFAALSLETGELLWRHHVHAGPFNVYGDRLYMATGNNFTGYRIVDLKTGETLFAREVSEDIATKYRFGDVKLSSGFAITETHTFVGDNFGRLWALERDTGEPVWYHHPKGAMPYVALRQPIISGNRLYINGFSTDPNRPQHLYCYEQA